MNITTMQMYWILMLENIRGGLVAILVMCGLFITLGMPMLGAIEKEKLFLPITKKFLVVAAASLLGLTFIPSTKQMAAIMIVPRLANSEKVQIIGNRAYDLAVEWMKELKTNKKEGEVTK